MLKTVQQEALPAASDYPFSLKVGRVFVRNLLCNNVMLVYSMYFADSLLPSASTPVFQVEVSAEY